MKKLINIITMADCKSFSESRTRRKLNFYLVANIIGVVVMLIFGTTLSFQGKHFIPIIDFTCSGFLFSAYLYLRRTKRLRLTFYMAAVVFMGFLFVHLLSGGTESSGPIWYVIFPPVVIYLLGGRTGLILSILVVTPVFFILIVLLAGFEFAGYSTTFILRFLIAYSIEAFLFYVMESQRYKALKEVKLLTGLLPICSKCKKIRDDHGDWNNLESYIEKHSQALFTHSICAHCAEELYGHEEWYNELNTTKGAK